MFDGAPDRAPHLPCPAGRRTASPEPALDGQWRRRYIPGMTWRSALLKVLAAVVLITAAGMPLRAPSSAAPGGDVWLVELCTLTGKVTIAVGPDGQPLDPPKHEDHAALPCLLCAALPGAELPPAPALPSLDWLVVPRDLTRGDASPRAPPLLAAEDHPPTAPPATV